MTPFDFFMAAFGLSISAGCLWRTVWLVRTRSRRGLASSLIRMAVPVAGAFFMLAVVLTGTETGGARVALAAAGASLVALSGAAAMIAVSLGRDFSI